MEHRLKFARRTADNLEHFRCRGLLLQCLAEIICSLPQFVEQPGVLDGDDRLVGEGLKQGDLSFSEELRLRAAQRDHSNCDTFSHQRDVKAGTEAHASCVFAGYGKFVLGLEIKNVDGPHVEN
jgi:hypothetical protein